MGSICNTCLEHNELSCCDANRSCFNASMCNCCLDYHHSASRMADVHARIVEAQNLCHQKTAVIYHGTKEQFLKPSFGKGLLENDFGQGFYTTPDANLGREWAYSKYSHSGQGYLHSFTLDMANLHILNLVELDILHWLAELYTNRKLDNTNEVMKDRLSAFNKKYKLDTSSYDVIIGCRADDSYFKYASDFLNVNIYKESLEKAMYFGELGLQVFIKSKRAFEALTFKSTEEVDPKYATFFTKRDTIANNKYRTLSRNIEGKTTILDCI